MMVVGSNLSGEKCKYMTELASRLAVEGERKRKIKNKY